MARKNHSKESEEPRRAAPSEIAAGVDPEDDVTSEISGFLAEEIADDDSVAGREDIDVTETQLSEHVDSDADETLAPGSLLNDRFEINELVHSGGMGHVYKAIDRRRHPEGSGQVHVAIKMLRESLSERQEFRMALEREAAKAQALSHPNIINIFDFDEHEGRFYIVMEWLEGESVNALLRRTSGQRLAPAFSWPIIEGAAAAIGHAHANGVVHADVNPSNIFITTTHDIKLLDFGVARYANELRDPAEDKVAWVTQTYASPEVLSGQTPAFEDDVFSLGCVAYRLLGGKHPFAGSPSIVAKRNGFTIEAIPGLPQSDWQRLSRALAYSRSERPDSVEVFLRGSAGEDRSARLRSLVQRALPAAATAVIALVAAWLFWPDSEQVTPPGDAPNVIRSGSPDQPAVAEPAMVTPAAAALRAAAERAMAERRLVLPENDNAREIYRELLRLDPDNPEALRGLRAISDEFVGRADTALRDGNPRAAAAALAIAAETDAQNPAISIVTEFLITQGEAKLTAARLAVEDGDVDRAAALLEQAEQFTYVDPAAISVVRDQIADLESEAEFLDRIAAADAHIAAGRLTWPDDANAGAVLAELTAEYGDDPRLQASKQRLGERLLTRAAFAAAAGRTADAEDLIAAAESLGVLSTEIEVARSSLAIRADSREQSTGTETPVADELPGDTTGALQTAPAATEPSGDAGGMAAAAEPAVAEPRRRTAMRMEDLGIERFVPPTYPRGAQRRGVTGFVDLEFDVNPDGTTGAVEIVRAEPGDLFNKSAAEAVRQWRFAPRDDTVRANVTLRFQISR